jgi:hypothetical protein
MAAVVCYPGCVSVDLMLLVPLLILLTSCINGWSNIHISYRFLELDIFWGMTLILARVICSEHANKATIWLVLESIVYGVEALVLGVKISSFSRGKDN